MDPADRIKNKIKKTFKNCIRSVNSCLLNATIIKQKIEDRIEELRLEINPLIETYVKKENDASLEDHSIQETASLCSESSKFYKVTDIDSGFKYESLLGKKKKLKVADFNRVEEDEDGKLIGLIKMAKSTRIKSFEKRTGATAISLEEYNLKLELNGLGLKSELFAGLNRAAQCLLNLSENRCQKTNDLFNDSLFRLVTSINEDLYNEFTVQAAVFSACWLASALSESCRIIGFERSFNCRLKGTTGSVEVDGAVEIGSTFILFEFKHHGSHHRVDAISCIKNRNYNGKIRLSSRYSNVICIGINFEGVNYSDQGYKSLETISVETTIKNSNIYFGPEDLYLNSWTYTGKLPVRKRKKA